MLDEALPWLISRITFGYIFLEGSVFLGSSYFCDSIRGVYRSNEWLISLAINLFVEGNDFEAPMYCLCEIKGLECCYSARSWNSLDMWYLVTLRFLPKQINLLRAWGFCRFCKRKPLGYGGYIRVHLISVTFNWKPVCSADFGERSPLGYGGYRHVHLIIVTFNWEPIGFRNFGKEAP